MARELQNTCMKTHAQYWDGDSSLESVLKGRV